MEDMRGNSRNEGAIAKANRQTTPSEWQAFSERNVQEAAEQVHRSLQLRVTSQALMQDIMRDTRCHADHVDQLFHDVIDRHRKAMDAFHKEHVTVCQQIQETEETASDLRAGIASQDAPLGSAIQQLARRNARPNYELCRDTVHECLETRVDIVRLSLRQLQDKLAQVETLTFQNVPQFKKCYANQAEASLRRLRQSKYDLEQAMSIKQSTLRIDGDQCMNALRRNMIPPQP